MGIHNNENVGGGKQQVPTPMVKEGALETPIRRTYEIPGVVTRKKNLQEGRVRQNRKRKKKKKQKTKSKHRV